MTSRTLPLDAALHTYLLGIGLTEHPSQTALREYTATLRLAKMQIAPEQGQFMAWLLRLIGARRYLEVGVFTGYSALTAALAMGEEGHVVACDVSAEFTRIAQDFWQQAGVAERISLRLGLALHTLDALIADGQADSFDFAFVDADKPSYPAYLDACHTLVRRGGIIAIDNVFLSGRVVAPQAGDPPSVHLMHVFNAGLVNDTRFEHVVLPLGDGLTLLRKR